jgi:uncharacterized protein
MDKENIIVKTAEVLNIRKNQINAVLDLVDQKATIPFIARYRKEAIGFLDEIEIEKVIETYNFFVKIEKRKKFVLEAIRKKGKLSDEIMQKIKETETFEEIEDIYLPFKERRKTKADKAIESGLLELSQYILKNPSVSELKQEAKKYLNETITTIEDAIAGAKDIVIQNLSDNAKIRGFVREKLKKGIVVSKVKRGKKEDGIVFEDYFDFSEKATKIAPHRVMAILRGEKEGFLNVSVESFSDKESFLNVMQKLFFKKQSELFKELINKSWKNHLEASIGAEIKSGLFKKATDASLEVFSKNLEKILLAPPFGSRVVIGIDPGIRTGCKAVLLDKNGEYMESAVLYLNRNKKEAEKILPWIDKYGVEGVAVGNGTYGRETLAIVKEVLSSRKIVVVSIDEDGASVYSASKIAREEFPDLDLTIRGAISIGRRFQDPMAELVKIPPESLGVGQYQHDIPIKKLKERLKTTVEWSVNKVGVNLNTASKHLLEFVSGLNKKMAEKIVKFRKDNGDFKERQQLKQIKGIGENTFLLAAGFLMIKDAKNPLDSTGVHPESYVDVQKIAEFYKISVRELTENVEIVNDEKVKRHLKIKELSSLITELQKKGIERKEFEPIQFSDNIKTIDDLRIDMVLQGVVDNVVDFGAFIDIGIKEKGLVHISKISNKFVSNIHSVLSIGDRVTVKILGIDKDKKRIMLSMNDL